MTENSRDVQLKASMDATGVRAGVEQAKSALGDLGKAAEREGAKAAAGLEKPGDSAEKSGKKVEDATRSMVASLQRATAQIQAADKGRAAYFEELAKQRGVSVDALKPYLDQLRQAEAAQKAASASLGNMGVSAAQTAAALRQVPAQFSDIVTSLASGQQPLTVFLQQGSQLKDAFGGAGNAAKALGGYVLGLINPFTVAAAAAVALGAAYQFGAQESREFNKTLILTGNMAGVTGQQLSAAAAGLAAFGITQGAAADALNQLAATGRVGAENLGRFAATAVQLEKVGGPAVAETVKAFAELGKAPLQAALKLDEATNFLTVSLYEQIKALEQQGRAVDAAKLAQDSYDAAMSERIPRLQANIGSLERLWQNVRDATLLAVDAAKQIGRPDTIASLEAQMATVRRRQEVLSGGNAADKTRAVILAEELRLLEKQVAALKEQDAPRQARAKADADAFRQKQALFEFDKLAEQNLEKQARLELEVERIRNLGAAAGKDRAEIEKQIAAVRAKAADDGVKSSRALNTEYDREAALIEKLSGLTGSYNKDLGELQNARKRGLLTEQQYVKAVNELIERQPFAVALAKQQADAAKELAQAETRGLELYEKTIEALKQRADGAAKQVEVLRDEAAAAEIAARGQLSLAQAVQQVTIARLEEQKAAAGNDERAVAAIQREIDKRRELIGLIGAKEGREAAKKSAEDAAREWKRASDDIERSITDALMRGFESGKGFGETLRDTLVNMFKTLVLRPVIQAVVQPVAGQILGTLGTGGTGIGGGLGSLGGVNSVLDKLGLSALASNLNTVAGPLASLYNISKGNYGAGIGAGIGSVLGGLPGLAIGNAIGSAIDGVFRGNAGTPHMGADYVSTATGGYRPPEWAVGPYSWGSSVNENRSQAVEDALKVLTGTSAALLNGLSTTFGGQANYAVGGYYAADNNDPAQANTLITRGGSTFSSTATKYGVSDAQEGLKAFTDELAGQVRAALRAMDIPEWAKSQLDALGNSAGFDQLANAVQAIADTKQAIAELSAAMPQLAGASDAVLASLVKQAGGVDGLRAITSSYFENFYTDAEKTALATSQLTKALGDLGFSMPASREAYKALVEAQDKNTESGQKAWLQLQALSPAFAALVPATQALGQAADGTAVAIDQAAAKMAEAGRRVLADLADQRGALEVDLLRAQGDAAGAALLERQQALAKLTAGLSSQDAAAATAAYELNAALREQISALGSAAEAAREAAAAEAQRAAAEAQRVAAIEQQRSTLEERLLQQLGDTAGLRARELAGIDLSNRGILERIYALQDQAAAEQAATQAIEAARQRAAAIASERSGLEGQLLQLMGDTAGLRARELAALNESNRSILERIYALQDEQSAAALAAQASRDAAAAQQAAADAEARRMAAIAGERDGLMTRLLQAQGNTAELRARELASLDASNRDILQRIYALEDERQAAQLAAEASRAVAEAAAESARQAEQLRQAWQTVTDGIYNEVQRIRGLFGNSPQSLAAAQSSFAITTAQARAGDQDAAKVLPGLSQTLLQLAEQSAGSLLDIQRIRAQVAASLEQTGSTLVGRYGLTVPKFDVGTNYVPRDMLAMVHQGEAIVPRAFNPALMGGGNAGLLAELKEVRKVNEGMRQEAAAQALAIVKLQTEIAKLLRKWDGEGIPEERAVA